MRAASLPVVFAGLVLLFTICPALGHSPPPILNPTSYASPSGAYVLTVDPSTRYGQGKGDHRLMHEGKEVWAKTLPFTLWEAEVTDDGVTVGYAYTQGYQGFPAEEDRDKVDREDWKGAFRTVVINADGSLRLNESERRVQSCFIDDDMGYPAAEGLFVDPGNDRFVIRMTDSDINRRLQEWRVYRLSDGKRTASLYPAKQVDQADQWWWSLFDAQPVAGTPLTLVYWYIAGKSDGPDGSCFTLVDLEGRPVWQLDRPGDYVFDEDRAKWAFRNHLRQHSTILDCHKHRQFELWFPKDKARVTFKVEPGEKGVAGWKVSEIARREYPTPDLRENKLPEFESIALQHLGDITLRARQAPPRAIRSLSDFDFDKEGRIGFVRWEGGGPHVFVLVDLAGRVLHEVTLNGTGGEGRMVPIAAWLQGEQWIVVEPAYGQEVRSRAWKLDLATKTLEAIKEFDCPRAQSVDGTGDGGFVVLATNDYGSTMTDELTAYDENGKRRWSIKEDYSDEAALFSPAYAATGADGTIAVVENVRGWIQVFDRHGKYKRSIDLEKAFGHEPSYPVSIAIDPEGGYLVYDFNGSPQVWRLRSNGKVTKKFDPKFSDGKAFRLRSGMKAAPDGTLWATDGGMLCRFSKAGVVEATLGSQPAADELTEIIAFDMDQRGQFYAVASQTGAVHVFNPDGTLHHICTPNPTDFESQLGCIGITVDGAGNVFVGCEETGDYLQFSPDGGRIGAAQLADTGIEGEWYFKPNSQERWVTDWQEVHQIGADGHRVRTIKRRPNRHWLELLMTFAVAPDGGFAAINHSSQMRNWEDPALSVFGPEGEPLRMVELPSGLFVCELAYDGKLAVLSRCDSLLVVNTETKEIRQLTFPSDCENADWQPFFSPDGKELWLHERSETKIRRYTIPSF